MSDTTPPVSPTARPWLLAAALVVLSALVLGSTVLLGVLLAEQTQQLGENVQESQAIVNANLRPLTQAQREILRLITLLVSEDTTADQLEQQRGFVSSRTQQGTLPSQIYTLGSTSLLQTSRDLRAQWVNEVEPLLRQIIAAPETSDESVRAQAIASLQALERGYNQLIADGELNHRLQGAGLNESTRNSLESAKLLLLALASSVVAFLGLSAIAGFSFLRLTRQREAAAEALVQANQELRKLSAVASLTKNLVVVTDSDGRIEWVNNAFVVNTGYALEEARGLRPGDLLQGPGSDPATIAFMHQRLQAGESIEAEIVNYAKDGREYWIAIEARPTFDTDGRVANYVAIETDVTARKQTEAALRAAFAHERELREMKSRFVIMTSHEFRTPLTTILSIAGYLKMAESSLNADKRADRLSKIEVAAHNIEALIEDVLLYDQTDTAWLQFDPQPVDLVAVTRDMVDQLRSGAGARHSFVCDMPGQPLSIQADRKLLGQILSNLLSNAVKYSAPGSPIEVQVRRDVERGLVRVRDHGIGIPLEEQKHIFEPFYRAGNTGGIAGTGLGMSILRNAVELHGGQIQFESREGLGTTFCVLLPAEPGPEIES
ncbi:MAG TPA: ATP-binding protein [Candidatus Limnocylindrales bacterium]|nr:ATP-binding protein [Candidatus Limnocylindrales bacterium]